VINAVAGALFILVPGEPERGWLIKDKNADGEIGLINLLKGGKQK
jgi:hypothetical protein